MTCTFTAPVLLSDPTRRLDHASFVLLQAHDENDNCNVGDTVRVHSCRPLSKRKSFVVTQILHRAKQFDAESAAQAAAADVAAHQSSGLGAPSFAAASLTQL